MPMLRAMEGLNGKLEVLGLTGCAAPGEAISYLSCKVGLYERDSLKFINSTDVEVFGTKSANPD